MKTIRENIRQISGYIPGKPIEELQKEKGLERIVKLASNENPYGPSLKALEAIQKASTQLNFYPDPDSYELRKKLAELYNIPMDWIVIGNGSIEIIQLLCIGLLDKCYSTIISEGTFIMYPIAIMIGNGNIVKVPMTNRTYDLEKIAEAIDDTTRIILIANPNNPTGTYVTTTELEKFMEKVPEDVIVVLDEAYFDFVTEKDYPNGLDYITKYPNIFVLRSLSKSHGLAGIRIGYGICTNKEIIDVIKKIRPPFNVNNLAQSAAIAAIHDHDYVSQCVQKNAIQRDFLTSELIKRGFLVTPSQANFLLVDPPVSLKAGNLCEYLLDKGVIVRPMGGAWEFPDSFRVSIGSAEDNLFFLEMLDEILKEKI